MEHNLCTNNFMCNTFEGCRNCARHVYEAYCERGEELQIMRQFIHFEGLDFALAEYYKKIKGY